MPHLELEDGFRLYYESHGEGPAVLFAHGAGGNAISWWQQVPAFRGRYRVITFDHRAFGRSPDIEGGPGRTAFGADAVALLDHLGVGAVHVVAHSMGARTAMALMRHDESRIRSLTLSGSNAGCVDDRLRARKAELEASGVLSGSLLSRALAADFVERAPELAHLYRQVRAVNPPRPADFLAPTPEMRNYRGSTAGRINDSGVPVLWVVGEHDRVVPAELVRISHELTPGSRYVEVVDAGHSAYFERAEAWNAAVRSFIDAVEDGVAGTRGTGDGRAGAWTSS
ncbi:MAG TPA: alpha/beta hydrolase [Dehalococcoidia bacterium]|nr:alpha/beta hydrolase [Dehalococcoidia bacterium]